MRAIVDNLRLSFGTLWSNPLRSLLTLLGIVIGTATVISMMALIEGLRLRVNQDLAGLGADVFTVSKWPQGMNFGPRNWAKISKRPTLTMDDLEAILRSCPSVRSVSAKGDEGGQKISTALAETRPNVEVEGVTPDYLDTNGLLVAEGRFISAVENADVRPVAVIGVDVADLLFPRVSPVGQSIRLRGREFRVIGVLKRRGSFLGMFSMDNRVQVPLNTFFALYGVNQALDLDVQAKDVSLMSRAQDEVTSLLRRRRNLPPTEPDNFEITTNESMTATFNNLSQMVSLAGFGVCLLSLVVGGIGVLNIMLVSVTERTREIGIRKALGARRSRILGQFATEAVVLSLVGGVLGIALGYGVAYLGRWVANLPAVVPPWAVGLSLLMSSGVGLVFGIYPAARAARLDPVEAMRAE
jgi:putative ABC transport system permease protein